MILAGPSWLWPSATFAAALIAAREWGRLGGLAPAAALGYAGLTAIFMLIAKWALDSRMQAADVFFGGICFFWALLAPLAMLTGHQWRRPLLCAAGMLVIFAAWHASASLFLSAPHVLLSALAIVWTADSAAYAVGKRWGKTPLAPQLSPGKTWEGLFGGGAAALALALFAGPFLFVSPPTVWLLTAVVAAVALAVAGDLFESSLKRLAGVKDSGSLLGGHGGVLDRLDALLPTLPFVMLLSPWLN